MNQQGRVFDCFTFYNEINVLLMRLVELYDVVDWFVLVEADRTFSNLPKPLYFQDYQGLFTPFKDKIIHVIVRDMPGGDNPWAREQFQRNAIVRGLPTLTPLDLVVISDVDEIPRPAAIETMRMTRYKFYGLMVPEFYFKLNFVNAAQYGVAIVATRPPLDRPPDQIRNFRALLSRPEILNRFAQSATMIYHAGWHFSYLGDIEFVKQKIISFSHQEYNTPDFLATIDINDLILGRRDLFNRERMQWMTVKFDSYFPRTAHSLPEFQSWIAPSENAPRICRDVRDTLHLIR